MSRNRISGDLAMLDQSDPKETVEYQEGSQSLQEGLSELINPYAKNTNEYRLWHLGWLHASINKKVGHILTKYGQELM